MEGIQVRGLRIGWARRPATSLTGRIQGQPRHCLSGVLDLLGENLLIAHHLFHHFVRHVVLRFQLDLGAENIVDAVEKQGEVVGDAIPTNLILPRRILHGGEHEFGLN